MQRDPAAILRKSTLDKGSQAKLYQLDLRVELTKLGRQIEAFFDE